MQRSRHDPDRLYTLLPAVYRERDTAEGEPLRALLRIVSAQAAIVQGDIEQLWDDFFIETCADWVVPYIGDLVGNNLLHEARTSCRDTSRDLFADLRGPDLRARGVVRTRADVAKTIYYRRRKGTLPMLEELARDVTGWPAHAVAFFEGLSWTQNLNHPRFHSTDCPDLRRIEAVDRLDGAFDQFSHEVDVRRPCQTQGWHNVPNVGFFLWRLRSYPLRNVEARKGEKDWQYHVSPLGQPAPLFSRWRREAGETQRATELHVPGPIRPAFFHEDIDRAERSELYGPLDDDCSLDIALVQRGAVGVESTRPAIVCRRLEPWPEAPPRGKVVAVDVQSGRLALGDGWASTERIDVSSHCGFAADLGGGPYPRGPWLVDRQLEVDSKVKAERLEVRQDGSVVDSFETLGAALDEWERREKPNAIISILDNRTYHETLVIEPSDGAWLVIEADSGVRPHLRPKGGAIRVVGNHPSSAFTLSGVLIEGAVYVEGDLGWLRLLHSTLVPGGGLTEARGPASGAPSLVAHGGEDDSINTGLRVEIAFSITGPLRLPAHGEGLWLLDSIVDGIGGIAIAAEGTEEGPGPAATFERATIMGRAYVRSLPLASETIFTEPVASQRRDDGCVRFCLVPYGSRTPRRFQCQPDQEIKRALHLAEVEAAARGTSLSEAQRQAIRSEIRGWMAVGFTSERYGQPGYAQLGLGSATQILRGAEDGSEMGAFCHLKQPQREANLRIRLDEYLPFGLQAGLIYVT